MAAGCDAPCCHYAACLARCVRGQDDLAAPDDVPGGFGHGVHRRCHQRVSPGAIRGGVRGAATEIVDRRRGGGHRAVHRSAAGGCPGGTAAAQPGRTASRRGGTVPVRDVSILQQAPGVPGLSSDTLSGGGGESAQQGRAQV
eukprot:ctg_63.g16